MEQEQRSDRYLARISVVADEQNIIQGGKLDDEPIHENPALAVREFQILPPSGILNIQLLNCWRPDYHRYLQQLLLTGQMNTRPVNPNLFDFERPWQNLLEERFADLMERFAYLGQRHLGIGRLLVISGLRSEAENLAYQQQGWGAAKHSPHLAGIAVDLAADGEMRYQLADLADSAGFGGIAVGRNHVHIDCSAKTRWKIDSEYYIGPSYH